MKEVKCAGDATGYALTVEKHYRSIAAKRKKESKEQPKSDQKKHIFTYSETSYVLGNMSTSSFSSSFCALFGI
ncbi:MAG: hypothetical protein QXS54_12300, partial [Candidatus Methanomethylicaceae archaeon]